MFLGGVNFPAPLLGAQENGTLVLFAGAGVSMDAPSNYPNFVQLAYRIGQAAGLEEREESPIDRYLGRRRTMRSSCKPVSLFKATRDR